MSQPQYVACPACDLRVRCTIAPGNPKFGMGDKVAVTFETHIPNPSGDVCVGWMPTHIMRRADLVVYDEAGAVIDSR